MLPPNQSAVSPAVMASFLDSFRSLCFLVLFYLVLFKVKLQHLTHLVFITLNLFFPFCFFLNSPFVYCCKHVPALSTVTYLCAFGTLLDSIFYSKSPGSVFNRPPFFPLKPGHNWERLFSDSVLSKVFLELHLM